MKDTSSLHKKVQEHCDCYMTTDHLKEMSKVQNDADKKEAAVKWLALAALHGINHDASEITITRAADGSTRVFAEYRDAELPSPGSEIGGSIVDAVRAITHIEERKGKTKLALGVRDSSVELEVKIKSKGDREKIKIAFPEK